MKIATNTKKGLSLPVDDFFAGFGLDKATTAGSPAKPRTSEPSPQAPMPSATVRDVPEGSIVGALRPPSQPSTSKRREAAITKHADDSAVEAGAAGNDAKNYVITSADGVRPALTALREGNQAAKVRAAEAIQQWWAEPFNDFNLEELKKRTNSLLNADAVETLAIALQDNNAMVRLRSAWTLSQIASSADCAAPVLARCKPVCNALIEALEKGDLDCQIVIARVLELLAKQGDEGKSNMSAAIPALVELLRRNHCEAKIAAVEALCSITREDDASPWRWPNPWRVADVSRQRAMRAAGAIEPLVQVLKGQDDSIKSYAAEVLSNLARGGTAGLAALILDEAAAPLVAMLHSDVSWDAAAAAKALACLHAALE